jgi:hypothetical protein
MKKKCSKKKSAPRCTDIRPPENNQGVEFRLPLSVFAQSLPPPYRVEPLRGSTSFSPRFRPGTYGVSRHFELKGAVLHSLAAYAANLLLPYLVSPFVEQGDTDQERGAGNCLPFFMLSVAWLLMLEELMACLSRRKLPNRK